MVLRRQLWSHLDQCTKQIEKHYVASSSSSSILETRSKIQSTIVPQVRQIMSELKSQDLQALLQTNLFLQKIRNHTTQSTSTSTKENTPTSNTSINFLTLLKTPHTELTAFVIPPNQKLPLHDHPDMDVCCKVVDGVLCEYSANWVLEEEGSVNEEERIKNLKKNGGKVICVSRSEIQGDNNEIVEEKQEAKKSIAAKHIQSHKNQGGVVHEFWTGEEVGAVFLDFFTPIYYGAIEKGDSLSTIQRDCTYFQLMNNKDRKEIVDCRNQKVGDVVECVPMPSEPELDMKDLFTEMMLLKQAQQQQQKK